MNVRCWSVPKYEGLNEDKWYIPNEEDGPIVLCDGASESFNSGLWADLLAQGLRSHEDFTDDWLKDRITKYENKINPEELSWSKQLAYERGSFSTFLSVQFRDGECLVNAAGDSVAFSVDQEKVIDTYHYNAPEQFLERPSLLATKTALNVPLGENVGDCQSSGKLDIKNATHVLLLTDAIAHWLMERRDDPESIRCLLKIENDSDFKEFVKRERKSKTLRFDDTTMIRIKIRECLPALFYRNPIAKMEG